MPPNQPPLVANLASLLALGKLDLPQMAYVYAKLNRDVAGTADTDMDAFGAGGTPVADFASLGRLYQAWSDLRNHLQDALGRTALELQAAADAVVSIVDIYAATDDAAKASINQILPTKAYDDEGSPTAVPAVILSGQGQPR